MEVKLMLTLLAYHHMDYIGQLEVIILLGDLTLYHKIKAKSLELYNLDWERNSTLILKRSIIWDLT